MTLPAKNSSRGRFSDIGLFVVSVILVLLAGGVAGLFFIGNAILDMTDDLRGVEVALREIRQDIGELRGSVRALRDDVATVRQDVSRLREETSRQFDVKTR